MSEHDEETVDMEVDVETSAKHPGRAAAEVRDSPELVTEMNEAKKTLYRERAEQLLQLSQQICELWPEHAVFVSIHLPDERERKPEHSEMFESIPWNSHCHRDGEKLIDIRDLYRDRLFLSVFRRG